jgi:hypothetical protein
MIAIYPKLYTDLFVIKAGFFEERQMDEQDEIPLENEEEHIHEIDEDEYWDLLTEA